MKRIHREIMDQLSARAAASDRKRAVHRLHEQDADPIQRMLNAIEPGSYVQPHKHQDPDKRELFFCLRGKMAVVIFHENGGINEVCLLAPDSEDYAVEVPPRTYHSIISLEKGSVSFEVKDGPWSPADDKDFAPWAPAEGNPEAGHYLEKLRKETLGFIQGK